MSSESLAAQVEQVIYEHVDGPEGMIRESQPLTSDFSLKMDGLSYHPEAPSVLLGRANSKLGTLEMDLHDGNLDKDEANWKSYVEGLSLSYAVAEAAGTLSEIEDLDLEDEEFWGYVDQAREAVENSNDLEQSEFYTQFRQGMNDASFAMDGSLDQRDESDITQLVPDYQGI